MRAPFSFHRGTDFFLYFRPQCRPKGSLDSKSMIGFWISCEIETLCSGGDPRKWEARPARLKLNPTRSAHLRIPTPPDSLTGHLKESESARRKKKTLTCHQAKDHVCVNPNKSTFLRQQTHQQIVFVRCLYDLFFSSLSSTAQKPTSEHLSPSWSFETKLKHKCLQ